MTETARPTYQALISAAVEVTGADRGWLLLASEDGLTVVAALGGADAASRIGRRRPPRGIAGFALASGQPAAVQIRSDDRDNDGAGGAGGVPHSIVAAPCVSGTGEVLGIVELVDAPGGSFTFDDVEIVVLLADIAGAAMGEDATMEPPPSPERLAASLGVLAAENPGRYAWLARAVESLL